MLSCDPSCKTIGTSKCDIAGLNTPRHVMSLGGGIDDLVNGLHGEVERHELALKAWRQQ